jgi:2,3-bisphosphoglycerate-independent phosphoglycerate mutase
MQKKILFLFLDGVGLGEPMPETNPFARVAMPNLEGLLGGCRLVDNQLKNNKPILVNNPQATLLSVDATLGIEGLPQSATGQAALLTGKNAPAWLGAHEGPKPSQPIMELTSRGTIFTAFQQNGKTASLLNAFPPRYFDSIERDYRLPGVIALSARQAGLQLKTKDDLFAGNAISADITGEGWRSHLGYPETPILDYQQAGLRLDELSNQTDLAVFEYWLTDVAGHHQDAETAQILLETLDAVIGSLVRGWNSERGLILLTSDHGNLEDLSTRHHTRNDVPLLLIGSQKLRDDFLDGLDGNCRCKPDLTSITPAILRFFEN